LAVAGYGINKGFVSKRGVEKLSQLLNIGLAMEIVVLPTNKKYVDGPIEKALRRENTSSAACEILNQSVEPDVASSYACLIFPNDADGGLGSFQTRYPSHSIVLF
jgi:hypothetical protein